MELTFDLKDFFSKTKKAIIRPRQLFKDVSKEKNWKSTFSYSIAISIVASLLNLVQSIFLYPILKQYLPTNLQNLERPTFLEALPALLISTIVIVLLSFVWTWFFHNWLRLLRVKGSYWDAYKSYVYSRAPLSLLGWIPWFGAIIGLYTIYVLSVGVSELFGISLKRAILTVFPYIVIMFLLQFFFYSLL